MDLGDLMRELASMAQPADGGDRERRRVAVWREAYSRAAPVLAATAAWSAGDTPAVAAVRAWLAHGAGHLVLRGGVGVGKTTAACVAVRHWTEPEDQGGSWVSAGAVAWLRPDELISAVLHSYDPEAPRLRRRVVIDDLGRETKPGIDEALCTLLDTPGRTCLITTNLTRAAMRSRYDARVIDRLRDTATAVDIPGASMRRSAGDF